MGTDEILADALAGLAAARDLSEAAAIAGDAARRLTGADGITFVVRDGDQCYYAEENSVAPLWKGHRFPLSRCVSGWVMLHDRPARIADVYADDRVPQEAYRPTFVKSLAVVPVRAEVPVGAISAYWASEHCASEAEMDALQAIADGCSVVLARMATTDTAPRAAADPGGGTVPTGAGARLRVMVVDDDVDGAESLELLLTVMGHEVRTGRDGSQALELGDEFQPDVVVMDIGLPGMDGYETARRIRERPWGRAARLVALTGWSRSEDKDRALAAGFDHHVTKPADPAALSELLARTAAGD